MLEKPWAADHDTLIAAYDTNWHHGLGTDEARRRLNRHGPNELKSLGRAPGYLVLLRQFINPLVIILLVAAGISWWERDISDLIIILVIIIINALIGWAQEFKAERAMAKLRQILAPKARVVRESTEQMVVARTLVPGDIILLEAGDRVPADARIIEAQSLAANQAILTGEALPDHKRPNTLDEKTILAERDNMVYLGTLVVAGQGVAVVTATGMKTELGQIAEQTLRIQAPLEGLSKKISNLSQYLLIFSILLSFATLAVGLFEGIALPEMFKTTISLLVSIVPESLPMVVTVILSVGLLRIYRHRAIIRKLIAAETLGSITTICVDKTGTITEGEIMVEKIYAGGVELVVTGDGHHLSGDFYEDNSRVNPTRFPAIRTLLEMTSLATMSTISKEDLKNNLAKELTDPTETAMAVVAAKAGFYAFAREKRYPELLEIPFDQELRLSTSIHRLVRVNRYIVKGSPEKIIGLSKSVLTASGGSRGLLKDSKEKLLAQANAYASQGYRVTVLGYVDYPTRVPLKATMVRGLVLAGFLIMADPIRPEVRAAIAKTAQAGIRTVMITGDHLLTAQAIGEQVGLLNYGTAIHAEEVTKRQLGEVSVIARATPKEKLIIVEQLQKQGQVVAMTGDGVNDAPALKRADVGIAMGKHGSDVAVEAADMVLLDDNFTSIVGAIEQGRLIWENLRKAALYLISTALAEVLIIVIALLAGWPLPLLAAQILWLNLVTEGLNSMSLTVEPAEGDLMARPPRPPKEPIIDGAMLLRFILHSIVMTGISLLVFHLALPSGVGYARTMVVMAMIFFHFYNLLNCRSQTKSIFAMDYHTNKLLIGMLITSIVLAVGAVYEPHLQLLLHTTALSLGDLLLAVILPASIIVVDELYKLAVRSVQAWAKTQQAFA